MVVYSNKYGSEIFTRRHNNYCDQHGLDPDAVDIDELNEMMRETNLIKWKEDSKQYYKQHAEQIKEKHAETRKAYYEQHAEQIKAKYAGRQKRYKEEHHEEILEKNEVYAQKRIICQCGCEVARKNWSKHLQSNKHKESMPM